MIEIWRFLAGLGLFLYGMNLMEHVLKKLAGRPFKIFLRKHTSSLIKSIFGGVSLTALLQSSSVVSLLVLAFVESGIISFRNALGIILGANLGTTISSWIVATLGFKLDIESYALPVVAVSAIIMFFVQNRREWYNLMRLFLSLGLLFYGLGLMKSGAESLVTNFNFEAYATYGSFAFVLIGYALTTIIQSSSATVAITLTAIHSQIISFPAAAAVVIGSELGTTMKIVFGGLQGSADKKRVAWGNFIFNLTTCIGAYIALPWLTRFIVEYAGIIDPLIALVFFQSMINLLSIILFIPLIRLFTKLLETLIQEKNDTAEFSLINRNMPVVPELAVDSLRSEAIRMLDKVRSFITRVIHSSEDGGFLVNLRSFARKSVKVEHSYDRLKQAEGSVLEFYNHLQTNDLDETQYAFIRQYLTSVRLDIHAAKSIKDIDHDFVELYNAVNDTLHNHYHMIRENWLKFDSSLSQAISLHDPSAIFEALTNLMRDAFHYQTSVNQEILQELKEHKLTELEASTLMNTQREMLSVKKSLLRSLAYLRLNNESAREFEFLPKL